MDISEIKELKLEIESIIPNDILDKSKEVSIHLEQSIENYKKTNILVTSIVDKVLSVKKVLENELEELAIKRSEVIAENISIFNERNEQARNIEKDIQIKTSTVKDLDNTITDYSVRVDSITKNIVGLMYEKDIQTKDLQTISTTISSMRINQIDLSNQVKIIQSQKEQSEKDLDLIISQVEDAKNRLLSINNEILIKKNK